MRPRFVSALAALTLSLSLSLIPPATAAVADADVPLADPVAHLVAGVPDSDGLALPVIADGRLLDGAGRPLGGTVRLYSWPRWTEDEAAPVELPLVAWTLVGPDGLFALRSSPLEGVLAGPAGKSRNLVLMADAGRLSYETHFSRRPGAGLDDWLTGSDEPAEPLTIPLAETSPDVSITREPRPQGFISRCHRQKIEALPNVMTTIGEVNSADEIELARFTYEKREDSHVSVAISVPGKRWRVGGTHHLDNETTAKGTFNIIDGGNYLLKSPFTYVRYRVTCGDDFNDHEEIAAERWEGGGRQIAQNRPGCQGNPYTRDYPAGFELERNKRSAHTWEWAASVSGASFNARTGYSEQATGLWRFDRSAPYHQACGDDNVAPAASRVFIGLSKPYPVDDCRPGRPC